MGEYDYTLITEGVWLVDYLTMDAPSFYLVEITEEQAEALMGTGTFRYLPNGSAAVIVKTISTVFDMELL